MVLEISCLPCSVMVDGIWLASVVFDGKYKYLKMSTLQ